MILIGSLLAIILVGLLIWFSLPRLDKKRRNRALNSSCYPLASAGQPKRSAEDAVSVAVDTNTFFDKENNPVNPEDFFQFIVQGNSMQFCGIEDKDLIFVAKGFRIVDLKTFPYILVLKNDIPEKDTPKYKIRRAWGISTFGDDRFEKDVRAIMASEDFQEIKILKGKDGNRAYKGDDEVVRDFLKKRLPIYEEKYIKCKNPDEWNRTVVISTTFDTDDKYIHFSIHPIANIVGIVKASFNVTNSKK